jgi:cell division protein FtsQ
MAFRSRGSVNDRPSRWLLLLRRQRWLAHPVRWGCVALVVVAGGAILLRSEHSGGSVVSLRERIGALTAIAGMRVKDIVVEGRANTPEPILRAALGVSKGDPIVGFSLDQARMRIEKLTWVAHATVERRLPCPARSSSCCGSAGRTPSGKIRDATCWSTARVSW